MSKIPLSISLVKENVSIENILRDINTSSRSIENVGVLYYKESQKKKSKVVQDFFCNKLTADEVNKLYTAVVQAALLVRRQIDGIERSFLVTFGMGRNLIKTECLQDKFGMHVVLNSIDPETVKSVDINILESVPMHDRIQSTKYSKINLFNINPERDLLREVTGKTVDAYKSILGDIVTGADSLRISIEVDINSLPERLEQIFNISQLDVYKRNNFGFIDNISPIKDLELRNVLNEKVVQRLNDGEFELVWISLPDVVDWKEINTIRYTRKGKDYFELDVKTILTDVYKDDPVDIDTLHKKRVFVVNQAGYSFDNWSIYKCLCADVEYEQKQYILSNGQWYLIEEDFAQAVNNYYNNALVAEHTLNNAIEDEVEEKYNKRVVGLDDKRLLMDKKLVNPYHLKDKVELCDILTTDKELIHVKRYSGSSTLSHLFNQGLVSGELLRRREFRNQVNSKLDEIALEKNMADLSNWKFEQEDEAFRRVNYKIIFAIITKLGDKKPSIPFFSKVAFRHVCERLKDYGYQVSLMKIGINRNEDANPELRLKRNSHVQKEKDRRNRNQN